MLSVECGFSSTFIFTASQVLACGFNRNGQLGIGKTSEIESFLKPLNALNSAETQGIVSFSASDFGACVSATGKLYLWGSTLGQDLSTPCSVSCNDLFQWVRLGKGFGLAVTKTGTSYSWGDNANGELGTGDFDSKLHPGLVEHIADYFVSDAAVGTAFTMALTKGKLSRGQVEHVRKPYVQKLAFRPC